MNPTVSVITTSRSWGNRSRREIGSSVANSLIGRERVALGQAVEQRRLAGVGVAADRDDRHVAIGAALAAQPAIVGEILEPLLEQVDPLARAAAVDLELGLAGAAPADPGLAARPRGEPRHHRVLLDQARQRVAQLGELDLELAVAAGRVLREDVEDQHRAIDDLELGGLADRAGLTGREIGIEDHELGAELHRAQQDLVELAAADQVLRIGLGPVLDQDVEHLDARGAAQLAQLGDPGLADCDVARARPIPTWTSSARSLPASTAATRRARPNSASRPAISSTKSVRGCGGELGGQLAPRPVGGGVGHQVADVQLARPARGVDGDRRYSIEPQQREVGEVVPGQRLAAQVGVDEPKAAEPARSAAHTADVGQHDLRRIADEHVLDRAAPIDQHADLAVELARSARRAVLRARLTPPR